MPLELPILIPFLAAALSLLAWRYEKPQRWLGLAGAIGLLVAGGWLLRTVVVHGTQTRQIGAWPAPFGITLVADYLSALMVAMTGVISTTVFVYSRATGDLRHRSFIWHPVMNLMLMGVTAAFLAGDLFNLYVWFEVLLTTSFVLMALKGGRAQMEGAIKYVTINLVASLLFLSAVGLLYGSLGTLNLADIARRLDHVSPAGFITTVAALLMVAFGVKAAAFPLFFWLPASYHTPPVSVSAIFAGLLTKVGVYSLIRLFTLFADHTASLRPILLASAALTMLTGTMGAIVQQDIRRTFSFSLVGHIGFMLLGLGLFTRLSVAGAIFYAVHEMVVVTALFLISGAILVRTGTCQLNELGGLYRRAPGLSCLYATAALALAGIPPLSGFIGEFLLLRASLEAGHYLLAAIAVTAALLTLYAMARIWNRAFWREPAEVAEPVAAGGGTSGLRTQLLLLPILALTLLAAAMGVFPASWFSLVDAAADELMQPSRYVESVLGRQP